MAGRGARRRRMLAPVLAVALVAVAPAQAATVNYASLVGVQITDPGSEVNTITASLVGGEIRVEDTTTPPTPTGMDCRQDGPNAVICPGSPAEVFADLGDGGDTFTTGDGVRATVFARAGDDKLYGADRDDDLLGGDGIDQISGGSGIDQIEGGPGNDLLRGGPGGDFFNVNVLNDDGSVNDTDPGDDDLDGEAGSDSLNGGRGGDVMTDSGTDGAKDEVHYGRGDHESAVGVAVTVADRRNDGNSADGLRDDVGAGIEQVVGTASRDELTGSGAAETLRGRDGDDRLNGGAGADTLTGGAGNDTLEARDGVADASLDCDDTSGAQGASDTAVVDAAGVDPAPVRCETVDRPAPPASGSQPPPPAPPAQTTGPAPPRTASLPTIARSDTTLTCLPGAWSGAPTFQFAFYAVGPAGQPVLLADGSRYRLQESDDGKLVFCAVVARSTGGVAVARSALLSVPTVVRMPELQFRTESFARERLIKLTGGAIKLTTKRRGRRDIDCALGGTRGSDATCSTAAARKARRDLDPGDVYVTTPTDGKVLTADAATRALPQVTLGIYDRSLDVPLPPVETKRKFGDDCPLTGPGFTRAEQKAFIAGLQGKYESVARTTLDTRECLFRIRDSFNRDQEADPYVGAIQEVEIDDRSGLRLTIERNRRPDLLVIPYHRRLEGRDNFAGVSIAAGSEINPGLGSDGDLTTLLGTPNDVCFHVREASTGRPVPGVVVRALDPNGRVVVDRRSLADQGGGTDANGNRCDRWRIEERGEYRFTFDWRGGNGVNEEGWLRIDAVDRLRETYTTISGRRLRCTAPDRCEQVGTTGAVARQAVVVEAVILVAIAGVLVKTVIDSNGRGVDKADAARTAGQLSGGDPEVSLFKAAGDGGVTPGFMTLGGKLAPGAGIISGGAGNIISGGAGNILSNDGASIISGGAGNLTAAQGKHVTPPSGGALTALAGSGIVAGGAGNLLANDGASIVSAGAGNMLSNDGASIISGGAGNLVARGDAVTQVADRAVISAGGQIAAGTVVAAGVGAGTPAAPIISGGAGN